MHHLVLAHASALGASVESTIDTLDLPHLRTLLAQLSPIADDCGDELSLSTPHERALAHAWGWPLEDGLLALVHWLARADGLELTGPGWGLLSPAHWHVGTEQVSLIDPEALQLDDTSSRVFFDVLAPLFADDGWELRWGSATRWYVRHDSLSALPTASLDRVVGRNVDLWLNDHPANRAIRRLQAEAQMLLYTHPANDAREQRGALPLNSFWVSATGTRQPLPHVTDNQVRLDNRLRSPLLGGDLTHWAQCFAELDAGPLSDLLHAALAGEAVRLTLCGERHARTWGTPLRPWWRRLLQRQLSQTQLVALIKAL